MNKQSNTSRNGIGYVFLSGAGLGPWIWQDVANALKRPSVSIEYPKDTEAGIEEYAQAALSQIKNIPVQKVIIVGHSLGGVVGLKIADALGDRLAGFVAVSASIPKDGGSFLSGLPFPQKLIMPLIIRFAGTKPSDEAIRKGYCNDLSAEQTREVIRRYMPESAKVYSGTSALSPSSVPKLYIKTTNDNEFPSTLQDTMQHNLEAEKVVMIDSGHLPMLSKPKELAALLDDFALTV